MTNYYKKLNTVTKFKERRFVIQDELMQRLVKVCTSSIESFGALPNVETTETVDGPAYFFNRNASILGVGHLDYVKYARPKYTTKDNANIIKCPQLDDRLGVWVLLDLLPRLKCVPFDVLLTDSEEIGRSTGQHFVHPEGKQYNWIFEFDREGTDVVMYEYEDEASTYLLDHHGFDVGFGSFSDISMMQQNCKGFNFGTGYYKAHTTECYAKLNQTITMANMFTEFANSLYNISMPHDHSEDYLYGYYGGGYKNSDEYTNECYWPPNTPGTTNTTKPSGSTMQRWYSTGNNDEYRKISNNEVLCLKCWNDIREGYEKGWKYCPWCCSEQEDWSKIFS